MNPFAKAPNLILVTLSGIFTDVNDVQLKKTRSPILVTLLGIFIEVNPIQPEKTSFPILVTLSGILIDVNALQFLKAVFPIFVILLESTTFVILSVAPSKMEVTAFPEYKFVISTPLIL